MSTNKSFQFCVTVLNAQKEPLEGLQVEIWMIVQEGLQEDQKIISKATNARGTCTLSFRIDMTENQKKVPSVYIRLLRDYQLVYGQERQPLYPLYQQDQILVITLENRVIKSGKAPFNTTQLNTLSLDSEDWTTEQRSFLDNKLNQVLLEEVRRRLTMTNPRLGEALDDISIDYGMWREKALVELAEEIIGSALEAKPELKDVLKEQNWRTGFTGDLRTVEEVLYLKSPLNKNPYFRREVSAAQTMGIAEMIGLSEEKASFLIDQQIGLDPRRESKLEELVSSGAISEEEKEAMIRGFSLLNFTGGNLPLAKELFHNHASVKSLVALDQSDWLALVKQWEPAIPQGESAENYAQKLLRTANRSYPTPFLLHRLSKNPEGDIRTQILNQGKIKKSKRANNTGSNSLRAMGNSYKYLRVPEILHDENLSGEERLAQIEMAIGHLATFYQNNPEAELRSARFLGADQNRTLFDWTDIPENAREFLSRQLMSYQRVLSLSANYDVVSVLLEEGLDSASAVVTAWNSGVSVLNTESQTSGGQPVLGGGDAEDVLNNAYNILEQVSHTYANTVDLHWGNYYNIHVDNIPPNLTNQLVDIPGYDQLFGPQNYCECPDCRSVLSPAAYFVDLMNYIKNGIQFVKLNSNNSPYDAFDTQVPIALKNRRPDLWHLKLTCENTYRLVPYLDIVNEIKETYLRKVFWEAMQNDANAENDSIPPNSIDIYALLADVSEKHSFHTPFNFPFAELKLLLQHFDVKLYEIQELTYAKERKADADEALGNLTVSKEEQIRRYSYQQYLCISREEWDVITHTDLSEENQRARYGYSGGLNKIPMRDFQKATGLTRTEVGELLHMKSFSRTGLDGVSILKGLPEGAIQNFAEYLENVSVAQLDFIHRLLRLKRQLPWSFMELDLALTSTLPNEDATLVISPETVIELVKLMYIQQELDLSFEQTIALRFGIPEVSISIRTIPNALTGESIMEPRPPLYNRLFDHEAILGEFGSTSFYHRVFNEQNPENQAIDSKTPYLLKGLGITESEWDRLLGTVKSQLYLQTQNGQQTGYITLQRKTLDLFYRHVQLAGALGWSMQEFYYFLKLTLNGPVSNPAEEIEDIIRSAEQVKKLRIPPSTLWFYLKGEETVTRQYQTKWQEVGTFASRVQNEIAFSGTPAIEAFKNNLASFLGHPPGNLNSYFFTFRYYLDASTDYVDYENAINMFNEDGMFQESVYNLSGEINPSHPDVVAASSLLNLLQETERKRDLLNWIGLEASAILYLKASHDTDFGIEDIKNLDWRGVTRLKSLRNWVDSQEAISELDILRILTRLPLSLQESDFTILAKALGADRNLVLSAYRLPYAAYYDEYPIDILDNIRKLVEHSHELGLNAQALTAFYDSNYADSQTAARLVRSAFRSKYETEEKWEEAYEPFRDRINEVKRDALCHFIIAHEQALGFKDANDLYNYFLIDNGMSGCGRTSRLLAATLSLQLLVHRVLLQLEQFTDQNGHTVGRFKSVPRDYQKEWEWRKNYRVWEANRKVFLYPENYLEPEWRDDKTPVFKELEDELLQEKITLAAAEQAYKQYLRKYIDLSNLKVAGACYDSENRTYHIFGRTATDPYQYYYRKYSVNNNEWTPWGKVKLNISSPHVGPVIYRGKPYLFWIDIKTNGKTNFEDGNSTFDHFAHTPILNYSQLNEASEWLQPQKIELPIKIKDNYLFHDAFVYAVKQKEEINSFKRMFFENTKSYRKVYPSVEAGKISIYYCREWIYEVTVNGKSLPEWSDQAKLSYYLNEFSNELEWKGLESSYERYNYGLLTFTEDSSTFKIAVIDDTGKTDASDHEFDVQADWSVFNNFYKRKRGDVDPEGIEHIGDNGFQETITGSDFPDDDGGVRMVRLYHHMIQKRETTYIVESEYVSDESLYIEKKPVLNFVHSSKLPLPSSIEQLSPNELADLMIADYVLEYDKQTFLIHRAIANDGESIIRKITRLSTTVNDRIIQRINSDFELFLSLPTQRINENLFTISFPDNAITYSEEPTEQLNFDGPLGNYYWELFFHIPYTIADHLNAESKYKEADWWYRRIFNPSAPDEVSLENQSERFWRFLKFRLSHIDVNSQSNLEDILGDLLINSNAIARYQQEPFNPHAIARLRLGAYPKAIVMKYIDNLLDWGDHLFSKDTWEDNNEALMLYMLARDILGPRPEKLGKCDLIAEDQVTYGEIAEAGQIYSEFLIYLENWVPWHPEPDTMPNGGGNNQLRSIENQRGGGDQASANSRFGSVGFNSAQSTVYMVEDGVKPVFCVPPNKKIMEYWDRVEDRLFKLRHCMNIDGVKRSLALFQPPIDPALLVAARASGLSLSDILSGLDAPIPPYRFSYLIEKAKGFTGTVQSFGGALLGALEKKDTEALTLLRSIHEQNILKLTKDIKKQAVEEAISQILHLQETKKNIEIRRDYYTELIDKGLTAWEITQQVSTHAANLLAYPRGVMENMAGILAQIPQVGAPTAMTFGGEQLKEMAKSAAGSFGAIQGFLHGVASSAGLEAGHQRRRQEWEQQLKLAEQELKVMDKQILAAQIRLAIAEKDLQIHETQIEQAKELYDFYKNKFTNLGLYKYMATTLNRLYSQAYNLAFDMAKKAEKCYQFETDETTFFIQNDNWDTGYAGLLAGERLSLQLLRMEKAFVEKSPRREEIRQSFSLRMLDPIAFLELRKDGSCTFSIPEEAFNIYYPGHYKRMIKSASITIPCVVGPYTNVPVRFTLLSSQIDNQANGDLFPGPDFANGGLSASSGVNDSGQLELNFQDAKYLPFEGGGAISTWSLQLPDTVRPFDYNTISDVILQLSYTAEYDATLRSEVETDIAGEIPSTFTRLLSVREEFPDIWYRLEQGEADVPIVLADNLLPYFMVGRSVDTVEYTQVNGNGEVTKTALNSPYKLTLHTQDPQQITHGINLGGDGDSEYLDIILVLTAGALPA